MNTAVIEFAPDLPVSLRREEIMAQMRAHQVLIVCGETGSGKTTQLPKMVLALQNEGGAATQGLIGHTQPRRLAASSVAKRIAQELNTPLGELVGYKVRFNDRISAQTRVKLMTDGILLAETQGDPLLKAYNTLIIDEAHERSLNIDFLLGYVRQLLPQRPDLKLIVTSATLDAERFAKHFADARGVSAPVIQVSGRLFPVEQRWRPFEESRDYGLAQAVADAVDELWMGVPSGDILVFLPGEREIREIGKHLQGHLAHQPLKKHTDILPLLARLSQAEQERVFESHGAPRVVLATNVAETSLTVPGIRYVIDAGTARVKRYNFRSKVEQLLVEPVSQAAAAQRAGRCGRVANGICVRLYGEQDFAGRPRFTDPEILRSSLAAVILRMKALHLGAIEQFPFVEAPSARAISDGVQLLGELGALDEAGQLTPIGQALARLPLDPCVGRMLIEAQQRQALAEVMVIAAALSVPDVRERPLDAQAQADQAQAKFDDDKSEFTSQLKLWAWLNDARGGPGTSQAHKLSQRQYEGLLKQQFINPRRVREWRDVYSQLLTVVVEQGWRLNTVPANYEQIHRAVLSGLLGNLGYKLEEEQAYLGARGIKFYPHPGARLRKKPGRWIVCAELVETARLFGRGIAAIEPPWVEQAAAHLLKKQLLEPHWEKKAGAAMALERATLYGLVVYSGRRVPYAWADPQGARELMIREGLVEGQCETPLPFLLANQQLIRDVRDFEHKSRRQDVLVDSELIYAFYDQQIPTEVTDWRALQHWYLSQIAKQPRLLELTREELMRHSAAGITTQSFPKMIRLGGVDCSASYWHEPGSARDGLTVAIPLFVLNQVNEQRLEWLVPGMLQEKILALLRSLPQKPRARLVPLPQTASAWADQLCAPERFGDGALLDVLLALARQASGLELKRSDFKLDTLGPHLLAQVRVVDEHGRQLGLGRNLAALKAELGAQARGAFAALAQLKGLRPVASTQPVAPLRPAQHQAQSLAKDQEQGQEHRATKIIKPGATATAAQAHSQAVPQTEQRYTDWSFGRLPELMEIRRKGQTLVGFPALVDVGDAVTLEVFDEPDAATAQHRLGLRRLLALQIKDALKHLEKNLPDLQKTAVAYMSLGSLEDLRGQIIGLALERAFLLDPLPADADEFNERLRQGRGRLGLIAAEVARLAAQVLSEYAQAQRKLKDYKAWPQVQADISQQLQNLVPKQFIAQTPWLALQHCPRYLKAVVLRLDKLRADPERDGARMAELRPLEQRYWRELAQRRGVVDARLQEFRWLLEELRVSFFAQELRTPQPVSVKRLEKVWAQLDALA